MVFQSLTFLGKGKAFQGPEVVLGVERVGVGGWACPRAGRLMREPWASGWGCQVERRDSGGLSPLS